MDGLLVESIMTYYFLFLLKSKETGTYQTLEFNYEMDELVDQERCYLDKIISMYNKIHHGDFHCPPWFSLDACQIIIKLLDPNSSTRITVLKLVEILWFKKLPISKPVAAPLAVAEDEKGKEEEEEPKRLNAFHLISLFEGFDLLPLFEQDGGKRDEGMRFTTREPASGVISRLEGVAARVAERYRVTKIGPMGVRLEGEELGRKGRLAVAAEIFVVAPSVLVVVIQKDAGNTLEYRSFCINELRPALQDIIWAATNSPPFFGYFPVLSCWWMTKYKLCR